MDSFLIVLDYHGIFTDEEGTLRPREEIERLLEFIESFARVGIFSSTMHRTIITELKLYNLQKRFDFILDRSHTRLDPDYLITGGITEYDTVKDLSTILNNPIVNAERRYAINNTIICDDSARKLRFISKENALILPCWKGSNNIDELIALIGMKVQQLKNIWRIQ